MAHVDKPDIRLGFWLAAGFFLFGLVLAVVMWLLRKAEGAAGRRNG